MKRTKRSLERNKNKTTRTQEIKTLKRRWGMKSNIFNPARKHTKKNYSRTLGFSIHSHPPLSQSFLAPNNPKLTAQSFSPITGVGSGMISQFLSG
jgi:hypothetical protein